MASGSEQYTGGSKGTSLKSTTAARQRNPQYSGAWTPSMGTPF